MTTEYLNKLLPDVLTIAREAAAFIRQERESFTLDKVQLKGKNDFVSYVDRGAEEIVIKGLTPLVADAGILSEEGGGRVIEGGLNWIVDPLDGTTNFIHGLPPFAVSIALVRDKEPLLGVILEVQSKEEFTAVKGGGAFLNGQPIQSSGCDKMENALIATGFPYRDYIYMSSFMETLDYFMHHSHGMRRLGSAAIDMAYVACGRVDAFYEYGLKPWDVAAGLIITSEAGCKSCDFARCENMLHGGELITATAPLFPTISAYIQKTMRPNEK